jgi:hypothetical protein
MLTRRLDVHAMGWGMRILCALMDGLAFTAILILLNRMLLEYLLVRASLRP